MFYSQVFPVPMIDRIILATNVKCSNGCEWIGDLGDMRVRINKRY